MRHQLIDRIEHLLLDTGSRIQILFRNDLIYFFVHSVHTGITIAICISEHLIIFIEQHIIHRPGIDPHAHRNLADLLTFLNTGFDLPKQMLCIPASVTVLFYHTVLKTMYLLQNDLPVFDRAQNMPSAGCPDIHRKIVISHAFFSFLLSFIHP